LSSVVIQLIAIECKPGVIMKNGLVLLIHSSVGQFGCVACRLLWRRRNFM